MQSAKQAFVQHKIEMPYSCPCPAAEKTILQLLLNVRKTANLRNFEAEHKKFSVCGHPTDPPKLPLPKKFY